MLTSGFIYLLLLVTDVKSRILWYIMNHKKGKLEGWNQNVRCEEKTVEIKASCFIGETETKIVG